MLDIIKEGGKLSAAKMAERLGLSQRQVQRILKQLKKYGFNEIERYNDNQKADVFMEYLLYSEFMKRHKERFNENSKSMLICLCNTYDYNYCRCNNAVN